MPGEVVRQDRQCRLNGKIQADKWRKNIDLVDITTIMFEQRSEKSGEK